MKLRLTELLKRHEFGRVVHISQKFVDAALRFLRNLLDGGMRQDKRDPSSSVLQCLLNEIPKREDSLGREAREIQVHQISNPSQKLQPIAELDSRVTALPELGLG